MSTVDVIWKGLVLLFPLVKIWTTTTQDSYSVLVCFGKDKETSRNSKVDAIISFFCSLLYLITFLLKTVYSTVVLHSNVHS
jgi:hypothetical protein